MTDDRTRAVSDEDGIALFYALLVALVVGGVVAIVFATAVGEQRQAAFELDFEDTIHTAEAGAELYLGELVDDNALTSGIQGPVAMGMDPAEWAIQEATRRSDGVNFDVDAVPTAQGETVGLRPTGEDAEFIYGVGFTPSRAAFVNGDGRPYARVVRVQVAFAPNIYDPQHAMLTGGNLTLSGNYKFFGSTGAVHTNGAIAIDGSTGTASGGVTYTGSCSKGCANASGPVAPEDLQPLSIEDFWGTPEATTITMERAWYENCSGVWYRRTPAQTAPCDGNGILPSPGDDNVQPWGGANNASYNGPTQPSDAVYYFHGGTDVDVKQPDGRLSILTAGNVTIGPSAGTSPPDARYPGWYVVAEGDVTVTGNATGDVFETDKAAVVWSNQTIDIAGTVETNDIAFVAFDSARIGSSYKGGGGGSITFNGDAEVIVPGEKVPIVVQWDEVLAP